VNYLDQKNKGKNAALILEDNSIFYGYSFGETGEFEGEVVFNTGMVGYTESLTDPSYHEQFLCLTYPLVGNYGVPSPKIKNHSLPKFFESNSIKVKGLIISELCEVPSHWTSVKTLNEWLKQEGVPGIYGIDTRMLTKKLREKGVMRGFIKSQNEFDGFDEDYLIRKIKNVKDPNERNLASEVSTKKEIIYNRGGSKKVVLYDCGVKYNIIKSLIKRNVEVIRVPYKTPFDLIMDHKPDGVLISNGPGDPKKAVELIGNIKRLMEFDISIFGICLGNQILAMAGGADTYKLKYGHRSQNQPSLDLLTKRCYITSQNHGYTVFEDTIEKTDFKAWFVNINDKTNEGIIHKNDKIFAVQFHPENNPGPVDTEYIFDLFIKKMVNS
jgi:carbamoyl-phosphate synthase small subunit